jgi:hypothetical protein
MKNAPWEHNPNLTKERILEITKLIVTVRGEVIERHDIKLGDTPLSLGIRAYECCRQRIKAEAKNEKYDWLSILTPTDRFTFCIGNTPVRFSRNEPDHLPKRKLIRSHEAESQMSLPFWEEYSEYASIHWFLIVDTPYDDPAELAYFVGYSEHNEIICQWEIPLEGIVPAIGSMKDEQPEGKDISSPTPILRDLNKKKKKPDEK